CRIARVYARGRPIVGGAPGAHSCHHLATATAVRSCSLDAVALHRTTFRDSASADIERGGKESSERRSDRRAWSLEHTSGGAKGETRCRSGFIREAFSRKASSKQRHPAPSNTTIVASSHARRNRSRS